MALGFALSADDMSQQRCAKLGSHREGPIKRVVLRPAEESATKRI